MKRFSINTIAFGSLRQHKKQYTSLTLGIILAIFFSASLLLFWSSVQVSMQNLHNSRYGTQDGIFHNCQDATPDELVKRGYIQEYGKASILEYFPSDSKAGFSAAVFDDTALRLIDWRIIDGRLPEKKGEIAVEQSALAGLRSNIAVGDTFTAAVQIPVGADDRFLDETQEKTYTLVGILSDHLSYLEDNMVRTPAYCDVPAAILSEQEQIDIGGKPIINYYLRFSNKYWAEYSLPGGRNRLFDIFNSSGSDYSCTNTSYTSREILDYDIYVMSTLTNAISVIAVTLILASCFGIINAFSSSLRERQQQIALLRAVGATRQQIRQIFRRETILIACMTILPAVILSCFAVWGIIQMMGYPYQFALNIWILLGTGAAGLLCIIAASFFPLWKASHIPPMQAIRDVSLSRRVSSRRIRTKLRFDVPKHVAQRSLTLYRGSQFSMIALMAIGIFALSGLLYTGRIMLPYGMEHTSDYRVYGPSAVLGRGGLSFSDNYTGITEQDIQVMRNLQSVKSAEGHKQTEINVIPGHGITEYLTDFGAVTGKSDHLKAGLPLNDPEWSKFLEQTHQEYLEVRQKYNYFPSQDYDISSIEAYDERQLKNLASTLSEGEINLDKLASGEEVLVYAPSYTGIKADPNSVKQNDYLVLSYGKKQEQTAYEECGEYVLQNDMFHAGDTITLSKLYSTEPIQYKSESSDQVILPDHAARIDREVTIGGIIDANEQLSLDKGCIVTSIAGLSALGYDIYYDSISITLSKEPGSAMETYLNDSLRAVAARSGAEVHNLIAEARDYRNMQYSRLIASISIIILLFAVCAGTTSNSFAARIQSGKRAIGTLRAVGASELDIWKMYRLQLIYLFIRGTILGILFEFSVLYVWRVHWCAVNKRVFDSFPPVWQPIIFVLLLFLLCLALTRTKLKRVLKLSIVQNIREL